MKYNFCLAMGFTSVMGVHNKSNNEPLYNTYSYFHLPKNLLKHIFPKMLAQTIPIHSPYIENVDIIQLLNILL